MTRTYGQARLLNKLQRTSDSLRADAAYLKNALDRVVTHLDEGDSVNSLGELQSTGVNFDRLCGLREAFIELASELECSKDDIAEASKGTGTYFSDRES